MKIRRLIFVAGFLSTVAVLVGLVLISRWQHSHAFSSLPKLAAAMRSYSHDQVSHGRPLPSSVTVPDLINGGYISKSEVRDLAGADVTFYPTASETDPQAILIRIRLPDGSQIVTLADGSVQELSR